MARRSLCFSMLIFLFSLYITSTSSSISIRNPSPKAYIVASCKATHYPALCVQCLSSYASSIHKNDQLLAKTAISISRSRAQSAISFVTKLTRASAIGPIELRALKDCIENLGDSADHLSKSEKELGHIGRGRSKEFEWHMSNVQTWVSTALTDQNTCLDGFAGQVMEGNIKVAVRRRVVNVAQVTSNALALVNRFAARHRAAVTTQEP